MYLWPRVHFSLGFLTSFGRLYRLRCFTLSCLYQKSRFNQVEVAGNSFQYFPRLRIWWVIITTLYRLMLKSWYQKTAQSLVNKLLSILWLNRLPKQQYDLLKPPLILAFSAYNSKMSSVTPSFCNLITISMTRCKFLQSSNKKFFEGGSEPP